MTMRSEVLVVLAMLLCAAGCGSTLQIADLRAAASAALSTCRSASCPDPKACADAAAALKPGASSSAVQAAAAKCWPYLP